MKTGEMLPVLKEIEEKIKAIQEAQKEITEITERNTALINENIRQIIYKLRLEAVQIETSGFKPSVIFDLPDHLRSTIRTLMDLGEATAEDICSQTGRSRSLESAYLNHLKNLGYVEKKRKGQLVYYKIKFK
ncbi:MAG: helix-turn-helix domain-containing protein [Methanoregulaceae archaeon]|jgi:DNA-binding transcriptional ArsR family regulator|nr:helix-turn-helix domain-containing protein [Methanoregulaceae archaeon]